MLEDMQLRGFSPRTQEAYVRAVHQLAAHFRRSPDQLGEADLREYFLYLTNVKRFARASFTIALCGIKFFYERTLSRATEVDGLWSRAAGTGEETPGHSEARRRPANPGVRAVAGVPGVSDHDLRLWPAPVGGGPAAGGRCG